VSRWLPESFSVDIGAHRVALRRGRERTVLASAAGDWDALGAELARVLPARARPSVLVADTWVRHFLLDPPAGVTSLRDCRLLLDARFDALYGQAPADWVLQASWEAGAPMLACALPRALVQALDPVRPASLAPRLTHTWNRHCARLPAAGAWCAAADGQVNLLVWSDARLRIVRQQRGIDADLLLARELARTGLPQPVAHFWSGDSRPSGWTPLGDDA
jgi:hypothetical protein